VLVLVGARPLRVAMSAILFSGNVKKLGAKGLVKTWKRRWLVHRDDQRIYYYKSEDGTLCVSVYNQPYQVQYKQRCLCNILTHKWMYQPIQPINQSTNQ
jgi:hypothetical protein